MDVFPLMSYYLGLYLASEGIIYDLVLIEQKINHHMVIVQLIDLMDYVWPFEKPISAEKNYASILRLISMRYSLRSTSGGS